MRSEWSRRPHLKPKPFRPAKRSLVSPVHDVGERVITLQHLPDGGPTGAHKLLRPSTHGVPGEQPSQAKHVAAKRRHRGRNTKDGGHLSVNQGASAHSLEPEIGRDERVEWVQIH